MHHILKNEVDLILPQFPTRKEKKGIFTALITGFIGLSYEGISSFLQNRRHKALHKAVKVLDSKTIQHNKLMHFVDSMVMSSINQGDFLWHQIKNVNITP